MTDKEKIECGHFLQEKKQKMCYFWLNELWQAVLRITANLFWQEDWSKTEIPLAKFLRQIFLGNQFLKFLKRGFLLPHSKHHKIFGFSNRWKTNVCHNFSHYKMRGQKRLLTFTLIHYVKNCFIFLLEL